MKYRNQNAGFTLIELLLVMSIIAILAITAVGGYTQYRRATLLDLSIDNVISIIDQQRAKAARGNFGGERYGQLRDELADPDDEVQYLPVAKCYGIYIDKENINDESFRLRPFEVDFEDKQTWNNVLGKWDFEGCGGFNPNDESLFKNFEMDPEFQILEMKFANNINLSEQSINDFLAIRFAPPDGEMEFAVNPTPSSDFIKGQDQEEEKFINFFLQYSQNDNPEFKKNLKFYLKSGDTEVAPFVP